MPKETTPSLETETELYPKKPFEEMKRDILSGRWKEMKYDVYWPGGHGEDYISERIADEKKVKEGIVLRNILLKWDENNKKVINEIIYVDETIFDKKKAGENKTAGYLLRDKNGEEFWESRDEFDESGFWKRNVIKDGQGNLLKMEEKVGGGETNIIYYDENNKEGLRITYRPGNAIYRDSKGNILEIQEIETREGHPRVTRRVDKNNNPFPIERHFGIGTSYDDYLKGVETARKAIR